MTMTIKLVRCGPSCAYKKPDEFVFPETCVVLDPSGAEIGDASNFRWSTKSEDIDVFNLETHVLLVDINTPFEGKYFSMRTNRNRLQDFTHWHNSLPRSECN